MRITVFLLAGLNLAWFLYLAATFGEMPDVAGQGWVTLIGLILAAFLIPALILAITRKAEWLAVILALIPLVYVLNGVVRSYIAG